MAYRVLGIKVIKVSQEKEVPADMMVIAVIKVVRAMMGREVLQVLMGVTGVTDGMGVTGLEFLFCHFLQNHQKNL